MRRMARALLHHHSDPLSMAARISGTAYEMIAADAIARFQRQRKLRHSFRPAPTNWPQDGVQDRARPRHDRAQRLYRRDVSLFPVRCKRSDISCDRFIRTSEADHYKATWAIWQAIADAGDLLISIATRAGGIRCATRRSTKTRRRGRTARSFRPGTPVSGPRRPGSSGFRNTS